LKNRDSFDIGNCMSRLTRIAVCFVFLSQAGCRPTEYSGSIEYFPTLDSWTREQYIQIARNAILQEFPYIILEDYGGPYVGIKQESGEYVVEYGKDSDREKFKGIYRYCHDNFKRERILVEFDGAMEVHAITIDIRKIASECIDGVSPQEDRR